MSNTSVVQCFNCNQWYCQECSTHPDWQCYCSTECREEADQ